MANLQKRWPLQAVALTAVAVALAGHWQGGSFHVWTGPAKDHAGKGPGAR